MVNPIQDEEEQAEATPSYVSLFSDLFAAACLNTFSSNSRGSGSKYAAASALAFFSLLWTTWLSSVASHTQDVVNLIAKLALCGVYALLAGYSNSFDIASLGKPNIESLQAQGMNEFEISAQLFAGQAWAGLTAAFAIGRLIVFLQYAYATVWAVATGKRIKASIILPAIAAAITGIVFVGVHFDGADDSDRSDSVRWGLCFSAVLFELLVNLVAIRLRNVSVRVALQIERCLLFTLIILGEGAIGIAKTISYTLGTLGFEPWLYLQVVLAIVALCFTFWIVFQGAESKAVSMRPFRAQCYSLLHFVLHAAILLFIESLGAALLYASLNSSSGRLTEQLFTVFAGNGTTVTAVPEETTRHLEKDLLRLGISWSAEIPVLNNLLANVTSYAANETSSGFDAASTALNNEVFSFFMQVFVQLYQSYELYPNANTTDLLNKVFHANATADPVQVASSFYSITNDLSAVSLEPSLQMLPCAGAILLATIVLRLVQLRRRPADLWGWLELAPRAVMSLTLIVLGALFDIGDTHNGLVVVEADVLAQAEFEFGSPPIIYKITDASWLLPLITFSLGLLIVVETALAWIVRRQQRKYTLSADISLNKLALSSSTPFKDDGADYVELGATTSAPLPHLGH